MTLAFSLTVTDSQNAGATDTCQVTVTAPAANRPPTANAGADQTVPSQRRVTLNGSGSSDPEGKSLRYYWTQRSGPRVILSDPRNVKPTFRAPVVTGSSMSLTFELRVADPQGLAANDTCTITVAARTAGDSYTADDLNGSETNMPPEQPNLIFPLAHETDVVRDAQLQADGFNDPDSGDHCSASQWQIFRAEDELLLMDLTRTASPLDDLEIPDMLLEPGESYIGRVRYFDGTGEPSPWSTEIAFTTSQSSEDSDANGIPDAQEAGPGVDLNQNGIPDREEWPVIKTLKSPIDNRHIGVSIESSPTATAIDEAQIVDPATAGNISFPASEMPYGLIGSKIVVEQPGQEAVVTLLFTEKLLGNFRWYRFDSARGWHVAEAPNTTKAGGYAVERRIKDGGPDDADGTANGIIVDLSGPRNVTDGSLAGNGGSSGSGGGGGGGCFIQSIGIFGRWF
jgi:hypothetical protein